MRKATRRDDSRKESGNCSRKGINENRLNTQRADRLLRSALKKCGATKNYWRKQLCGEKTKTKDEICFLFWKIALSQTNQWIKTHIRKFFVIAR